MATMFWQPTRGILQPNQHWRRGQGATITTVYGDATFGNSNAGWGNYTMVHRLEASDLAAGSGTQMRMTTELVAWTSGGTMKGYMGQAAAAGDAYDFLSTPAQILWSGSASVTSTGSNLVLLSDFVTLPEAYDEAKVYLFAYYFSNVATVTLGQAPASGGIAGGSYYKLGDDAATVNKTGYTSEQPTRGLLVRKVEVQ